MSQSYALRVKSAVALAVCVAMSAGGATVPDRSSPLAAKEFRNPAMYLENRFQQVDEQAVPARTALNDSLADLHVSAQAAYLDVRSGRWATLMSAEPLLPGEGNSLAWGDLAATPPASANAWQPIAWNAFVRYLEQHSASLGIDVTQLAQPGNVTVHDDGALVQINAPRVYAGVPVRDSYLTAVVNHGNLVLFGANNWGTIRIDSKPAIDAAQASAIVGGYARPLAVASFRSKANLAIVPLSAGPLESLRGFDSGYDYRLVWVLTPEFAGEFGTWEALVDAHSGELLAFEDKNQYQTARRATGGVYPVSNDLVPPDGVEVPGYPLPYLNLATGSGNLFTDTGGNLGLCVAGNVTTALDGPYVRMNDTCGAVSETSPGNLDLSASAGTDCTVPAGHSVGDTHASRTGFFELNKIMEQARGQLPNNPWLQQQLTSNMNINLTCNGFWNGATVNFYRSGGGCNNTGEIAAVFDHEWGHGMDNNDANGAISNPGEGIADIYMTLRLKQSCVARHFRNTNCGGYGDACLSCTGVRDIDWDKRSTHTPHNITSLLAICPATGSLGPCGRETHCESMVYAESLWDLFNRDLPTIAGMSSDTALETATRLTYLGAGPVGTVYQCTQGSGGCGAAGGYLNYLAADDDDGNLTNGTPHMGSIFSAFNRHGIACSTPANVTSGCSSSPSAAPVVTATAADRTARLSWTAVPSGIKYRVYRSEGEFGCNFGKVLLGETFGTTWTDSGLQNGRNYFYTVAAVGLSNTCLGPMSSCTTVTPSSGANLSLDGASVVVAPTTGDGDNYIDNCEQVSVTLPVSNIGAASQTNVRVASVEPLSHPGMTIVSTVAPVPSLAACATASTGFVFRAVDMAPDATVRFRVNVTSDELSPATRSQIVQFANTEGDNQFRASQTFDFETGAEGWQTVTGTFNRTSVAPGGAGGAGTFYYQSSAFLDNQCDEIQSPVVSLTATSTLSLQNFYDIEPFSAGSWYDRANVGRVNLGTGARTVVTPSGGRTYNASGPGGVCGLDQQPGWAAANANWGASSWTAAALGSASVVGQPLRLNIKYGTDPGGNALGFRFDQVTLTDFNAKVADGQTDQCSAGNLPPLAVDDSASGPLGALTVAVLANDSEPNGQCMKVSAVTTPANGIALINNVGCSNVDTVTYIPRASCGSSPCSDSFQYTVSDQNGGTATATVFVTMLPTPVELMDFEVN
jgi:trimeric autotransporter adhesin